MRSLGHLIIGRAKTAYDSQPDKFGLMGLYSGICWRGNSSGAAGLKIASAICSDYAISIHWIAKRDRANYHFFYELTSRGACWLRRPFDLYSEVEAPHKTNIDARTQRSSQFHFVALTIC